MATIKDPLHILVVEDNVVGLNLMLAILGSFGYSADIAQNGVEALDKILNGAYDLVLLDVMIPGMSGIDVAAKVREKFPKGSWPVIIAITANAFESNKKKCLEAGMDEFISKPVDFPMLKKMIKEIEKRRRS